MTALLNLFCSAALVASAQFGKRFLQSAGPEWGTRVGAGCFFLMGTLKIFEELRKRRRKKQGKPEARLEYLEKQLHPLEFGLLAVSMSVDGIVSGVFAADLPVTGGEIFFASFAVGMAAMYAGTAIGKKTGQKNGGNGALFGGLLLENLKNRCSRQSKRGKYMISVVIPSYNGAETLFQAIDSVLCQTTKTPLEILVIDDNSTDDTMEKMGRYGENDRVRYIRNETNK